MARTKDKTVYKSMGFNSFGLGSNGAAVDVKDGKIARIRPMHLDEKYSVDEIKPWTIESHGKKLESGLETTTAVCDGIQEACLFQEPRSVPDEARRLGSVGRASSGNAWHF